jgi:ribosomal protein S18 acetylase RimI-like enzyme
MNRSDPYRVRPMAAADVARLNEIDGNFESPAYLDVVRQGDGLNISWRLLERALDPPFERINFDFDADERRAIRARWEHGTGLWLVAEHSDRLVAMIDVERQDWRVAGFVWNIAVDRAHRRHGLGRRLMDRVVEWGRRQRLRAIILETQTNNIYACRFYYQFGFRLSGIDDHFYSNGDLQKNEVAIFWTYEL